LVRGQRTKVAGLFLLKYVKVFSCINIFCNIDKNKNDMSKQDQFNHNLGKLKSQNQQERDSNEQANIYDVINDMFVTRDNIKSTQ
jgi:hypothetical protein